LKKYLFGLVIVCTNSLFQNVNAQQDFASIEKNINVQAKSLFHDLNKTKDTLLLKSDKKINYAYTINKDYKREVDYYIDATSFKIPLNELSKGKHLFVVVQSPLRIVFVVRILKDKPPKVSIINTKIVATINKEKD
jgi:hypothetical protein